MSSLTIKQKTTRVAEFPSNLNRGDCFLCGDGIVMYLSCVKNQPDLNGWREYTCINLTMAGIRTYHDLEFTSHPIETEITWTDKK